MESLIIGLNAVIPLLICMAVGYFVRVRNWVDDEFSKRCTTFCFKTFMGFLIFQNIYGQDLSTSFNLKLLVFCWAGLTFVFFTTFFLASRFLPTDNLKAVLIHAIYRCNYVIFGIPIAQSIYGEGNVGEAAVLAALCVPLLNIYGVVTMEYFAPGKKGSVKSIVKGVLTNPAVVGVLCAFGVMALRVTLPEAIEHAVINLSRVSTPLSLVLLGTNFKFGAIRKNLKYISIGVLSRTILIPCILVPVAILLGFRGLSLTSILIMFGAPAAVTTHTMAVTYGYDGDLAGQLVVFGSIFATLTIFIWIVVLKNLGLI